jgi:hypothetical protein
MKFTCLVLATAFAVALVAPVSAQSKAASKSRRGGRSRAASRPAPTWPAFEARRAEWVRRKEAAAAAGLDGPDPLAQYLVGEVVVTGVFDTDGGYGVFLHATPTGNTFFATPGTSLFNGALLEILPGANGISDEVTVVFAERGPRSTEDKRVSKRIEAPPVPAQPE